ncbi:MAG: tetratricopeptide repeat protein [Desulfobacteraceae bacterium]|nr:tetratricopeptide repeat protein [Desulfobacteraceae bacterium]
MPKKKKKKRHTPKKISKLKKATGHPKDLSQTIQLALTHHKAGDLVQAEQLYKKVLAKDPGHADANHFLGVIAKDVGKYDIAVQLIKKSLDSNPSNANAHYNLGGTYEGLGRLDDAISSYKRALSLKPDFAQAHNNLGNIFNKTGQTNEAVSAYKKALAINPRFIVSYNNLGNVLQDDGQIDEAIATYKKALLIDPECEDLYNNLGIALKEAGLLEEAISNFKMAVNLQPKFVSAYINQGNVLKDIGQSDKAIAAYKTALSIRPDDADALHNLGIVLEKEGQTKEAIDCFKKAVAFQPDYVEAHRHLSNAVLHTRYDDQMAAMESLYLEKNLSSPKKAYLGFALGKAFEDIKAYEKSFDYIFEANRLKRSSYQYAILEDQDKFNQIKQRFLPDFFSPCKGMGCMDDTPIFILGMPRSGTTLVEQILASHPLIFGAGELHDLSLVAQKRPWIWSAMQSEGQLPDTIEQDLKNAGQEYIKRIRSHAQTTKFITDKMPQNFLYIGWIKAILPNAKVIHCTRTPMDTCFSIYKNHFSAKDSHKYAYDLKELGQYYNLYLDLMEHWETTLPGFIHEINYEKLVSDQENQTRKLVEYCQVPWNDDCLSFHKTHRHVSTASALQVRRPIYKDSVALWKQHEDRLTLLKKIIYNQ